MNTAKPVQNSKTILFNLLVVVIAIAGYFGFNEFAPDQQVVEFASTLTLALSGLINLVLRLKTVGPVVFPSKPAG